MSNIYDDLTFPTGRSVKQAKKDANRLKKEKSIPLHQALNQIALDNGLDLPWHESIQYLRTSALQKLVFEEHLRFEQTYLQLSQPSSSFSDVLKLARGRGGIVSCSKPSLMLDFSSVPFDVYNAFVSHPIYIMNINCLLKLKDLNLQRVPAKNQNPITQDWQIRIKYDGYCEGEHLEVNSAWNRLLEWLNLFLTTGKLSISYRASDHDFVHLHSQTLPTFSKSNFVNQINSDINRALYFALASSSLNFDKLTWNITNLEYFKKAQRRVYQAAVFEYHLSTETDTVAAKVKESYPSSPEIRLINLFLKAVSSVTRHYKLDNPDFELNLIELDV
ncbi:hypothetical protein DDO73_16685 [Vibrio cholerae]|uniref:Uncharacterized protein n=1 Tax=Vibrio cholerae TaxID=666 RepID=A0ABD7SR22_VIBCL|nr:hypothetical protein [Vibrio cholerae]EGR4074694.1 hypothetical protein [Vibrio cholerae]TXX67160.1 hypothetical protein FXF03_00915 [Vibrio cholerae]GIA99824.1 hypothetical protein VCSRO136_2438 [Vibrio cholerae]